MKEEKGGMEEKDRGKRTEKNKRERSKEKVGKEIIFNILF